MKKQGRLLNKMNFFNKKNGMEQREKITHENLTARVKKRVAQIENKKVTAVVMGVWAAAFLTVIVVCRMNGTTGQASGREEYILIEAQTTTAFETTSYRDQMTRSTAKKTVTTEEATTQQETTTEPATTTMPAVVAGAISERETLPIEQLEVSNEVMYDDVEIVRAPMAEIVVAPSEDELVAPVMNVQELIVPSTEMTEVVTQGTSGNMADNVLNNNPATGEKQAQISNNQTNTVTAALSPAVKEITTYHNCIDISYHQGKIDWAKVKASGIDYAFIRVGYRGYETGKMGKDVRFEENIKEATANGIKVGVYFFSQALNEQEALEEASVTLNYIKNYPISLPVVIDWETTNGYRTYNAISADKLTNVISVFCDTVKAKGYTPMVYMCKSDYQNRVNTANLASKYEIWVAWYLERYYTDNYAANLYKSGDKMPALPYKYQVWQYTSKGAVDGIAGPVDMNIIVNTKKVYEPKLVLTNRAFTVNVGGSVDVMDGVQASDLDGNPAVSQVAVTIVDSNGNPVSKTKAMTTAGKYSVKYVFRGSEFAISDTATLYVRDVPKIYFEGTPWTDNGVRTVTYEYDHGMTAAQNYSEIEAILKGKLSAVYYFLLEGTSARIEIKDATWNGLQNIYRNDAITEGEYPVTYTVNDGRGLSNSKTVKVIVKIPQETIPETVEEVTGEKEEEQVTQTADSADGNIQQSTQTVITATENTQ